MIDLKRVGVFFFFFLVLYLALYMFGESRRKRLFESNEYQGETDLFFILLIFIHSSIFFCPQVI